MTDQPDQPRFRLGVPAGGHVSGVFWGDGPPELVFLHDAGESARAWDTVALAAGRASVAIDLPGHGRSDSRRDGRYEPGELAPAVAEAIRSFAPRADRGRRGPGRPHRGWRWLSVMRKKRAKYLLGSGLRRMARKSINWMKSRVWPPLAARTALVSRRKPST